MKALESVPNMSFAISQAEMKNEDRKTALYTRLAREYYSPVYCFIARQVPHHADAEDLSQETFVRAYRSFHRFDEDREFAPWIYSIARRCLADFFRKNRPTFEEFSEYTQIEEENPRDVATNDESADQLWSVASSLKPKHHQVLLLHYQENFSVRETAKIMGISGTHAKVLLFRAREALKKKLVSIPETGGGVL